jgi:ABC-type antimicrobial peptide transport system permease subunit
MRGFSTWFVWKKAYRTLMNNKSKTLPILLLLTFAIGFGTVLYDMQDVRGRAVDEVIETTNFADGFAYYDPLPQTHVDFLLNAETYPYFDDYEMRMLLIVKFEISDEEYDGLLVGIDLSQDSHINSLIDAEKNEIDDYEFALNMDFAEENSIKKGEELSVSYGSIEKKVEVEEIGYNPEFQFFPLYKNVAFPSVTPYPILYLDIRYLNEIFLNQSEVLANQLIYQLESKSYQDDVEESIENSMGTYLDQVISQEEHPFIKGMREDEESDRIMILILTGVLLGGAIITLIIIMNKLVEEDLKSVSVFQALGANKREILLSYLLFNVLLVGLSVSLGVILSIFLNIPVNNFILDAMNIPITLEVQFSIYNPLYIGSILFLVSITSTFFIVKKTFKMDVLQTLKYETKFLEKRGLIEKLYVKTRKAPNPFVLYNLRRIFGRKMHLYSLLAALSFSASLLVFMFSFQDSLVYSMDQKFNYVEQWDCAANTWNYENESLMEHILEDINYVEEFEMGISDAVLFSKKSGKDFDETFRILAFEEDSDLHILEVEDGKIFEKSKEVLVSKDIISKFDLRIGAEIYVKTVGSDESHCLVISGTVNDLTESTLFLSIEKAQDILNETDKVNTIYFLANEIDKAVREVLDLPMIEQVVKKDDIQEEIDVMMELASTMFLIYGFIFFCFGFLLIFIVFKSIIDYRIEDYSNMKAIGLYNYEVRKTMMLEMFLYFIIALLFGLLFGFLIMDLIITIYSSITPGLKFYLYPTSYLSYIISFSVILISSFIYNYQRVKNINVAEIMRLKTFG